MCLTAKNNHCFRVATKDIVCYKVVRGEHLRDTNNPNKHTSNLRYFTPYTMTLLPDEVINGTVPFEAKGTCQTFRYKDECLIEKGYIHTFAEYPKNWAAKHSCGWFEVFVFKCIIPKGTRYVKGTFEGTTAYASKKIVFVEQGI